MLPREGELSRDSVTEGTAPKLADMRARRAQRGPDTLSLDSRSHTSLGELARESDTARAGTRTWISSPLLTL